MKLKLYRTEYLPTCVKGNLYVDGSLECFTLEPPLKFNGQYNIPDKTCVEEGTFLVKRWASEHFDFAVPLLVGVPQRDSIEIHPLNLPSQTKGCIGVGAQWVNAPEIGQSDMAFRALLEKLENAWANQEQVTITIDSLFGVPGVSANPALRDV